MAHSRSKSMMEMVEFARSLMQADPSIRPGAIGKAVRTMFGSGLSPVVLSNLKAGKDPFAPRVRTPRKKRQAKSSLSIVSETMPEPRIVGRDPIEAGDHVTSKKTGGGRSKFLVVVASEGITVECDGKTEAKREIKRLLSQRVPAKDILLYRSVEVKVDTVVSVSSLKSKNEEAPGEQLSLLEVEEARRSSQNEEVDVPTSIVGDETDRPSEDVQEQPDDSVPVAARGAESPVAASEEFDEDSEDEEGDSKRESPFESEAAQIAIRKAERALTEILSGGGGW